MLPSALIALFLAGSALSTDHWGFSAMIADRDAPSIAAIRYDAATREISNWRSQTVGTLEPKPVAMAAALLGADRPVVTRCVKLNNYWCIKSARWDGEIGKDSEGHVGFASADHGADAAVTLLRRYYLEFGRKSALDIVRRWAPAECGIATGIGGLAVLAVKGIGGTVRARYLASRRGKGVTTFTAKGRGGKPGRVSMVIPLKTPQYRVPDIAEGMGEKPKPVPKMEAAPRPKIRAAAAPMATASAPKPAVAACAPDEQRLRNYAERMVGDLDLGPNDDLKLFAADGTPLPNLTAVMAAMSSFELGMLRPGAALIEGAVQRAILRAEARKAAPSADPEL
ncbi:hypothetical protein [Microvirga brassicacearum]|uniref:Uncharacterized protein n=1 Tax=Microvirga brassicacearum TaxID=2580413 RepID=A0A5N3PBB3_9HYPH|nr:hypothetical protein [Microvirga brassicacearum]KAB0266925.1 hypothetical protein FEZ63_10805 [Microvirga brassicacearum]